MNFNEGDIVKYQNLTTFYKILEVDNYHKLVLCLGLLDNNKKPVLNSNGEIFTIKAALHGWKFKDFKLVESEFQGPIPKHYAVCQKIKDMDKRFKERKLA